MPCERTHPLPKFAHLIAYLDSIPKNLCDLKVDRIRQMISVAICTYNRASSLATTLGSLTRLADVAALDWELLVIDNNSTDDTSSIVDSYASALPLRYFFESVQGLSAARNRAIREYRGEILLFTDDDVTVDSKWLFAHSAACRSYPLAGYYGGRIVPSYPNGRPRWLTDEGEKLSLIDGLLVRFHLGETVRPFAPDDPTPFGANFALRRSLIDRVGEFRRDLGVTGSVPGRGEEADYLDRAIAIGATGVYVGSAIVNHATDRSRLTLPYLYQYGRQKGIAARRTGSGQSGSLADALLFLLRGFWQILKGRGDRFRQCIINCGIQMALWRSAS